jgi:diguanylate cyclase (GGDEF)-like protein
MGLYFANPHVGGLPPWALRYPLYIILNASAAVGLVIGIRHWRPEHASPWWLMAIGQASYTVGDFLAYWGRYMGPVAHYPGYPDIFYLGRVPFMIVALTLMIRRRSGRDRGAVIDCLIIGLGVGILSWVFLMAPYTHGSIGLSVRLTSLAYPLTDLMLVTIAVRLLAGAGRRGASFYFLTGGLILLAATDSVFGWLSLHGSLYAPGSPVEVGWLVYYLAVGACGLHPSMRDLASPMPRQVPKYTKTRLMMLGAAALAGPLLLASEAVIGSHIYALPIALASIGTFVLVLLRLSDVMRLQQQDRALIMHQAFHDPLTGLANRALFYDRLDHALKIGRRRVWGLAVLMVDLDRFKLINDRLGHAAGDELLITVASRITANLRSSETVARLGGDEFVILAEGVKTVKDAGALAQRVIDALAETMYLAGHEISVGASVGVAVALTGTEDPDTLVNDADAAMYAAKRELPGTYRVFEPTMRMSSPEVGIDVELRRALREGELVVYYQPIVSLKTEKITGVEALVRWRHPQLGLVPPAAFIPAAEASGIIVEVGDFVLRQSCQQLRSWHDRWPGYPLGLSVNLSARELAEPDLVGRVVDCLKDTGIGPEFVTLELTESAFLVNPAEGAERLSALKQVGIKLALDDFGTEFSSLSHVRRLPVDCLKIDKSFVDTIATEAHGFAFIKGVVQLAHTLGLKTVAEGVEDLDQVSGLRRAGCDYFQGYIIARPQAPEDIEATIAASAMDKQGAALALR